MPRFGGITDMFDHVLFWQWVLVVGSSLILLLISPVAKKVSDFFKATGKGDREPGLWLLTSSLVISWIFAKVDYNCSQSWTENTE